MVVKRAVVAREAVEIDALAVARQPHRIARAIVVEPFLSKIDVEIVGGARFGRQRQVGVGGRAVGRRRFVAPLVIAGFAVARRRIEQRIAFERLGQIGFEFEVRQREQLDRLLQLRRHHQRLRLA